MSVEIDWQTVAGIALCCTGAGWAAWQYLTRIPSSTSRSADQKPPAGFTEHVACVRTAAAAASAEVVLEYLSRGLTEADTLREEVTRMGGQKP